MQAQARDFDFINRYPNPTPRHREVENLKLFFVKNANQVDSMIQRHQCGCTLEILILQIGILIPPLCVERWKI